MIVPDPAPRLNASVLSDGRTPLDRFASLEPPIMFVRNQVAMQLRKRKPQNGAHA